MCSSGIESKEIALPLPECLSTKGATYIGNGVRSTRIGSTTKNDEFFEAFRTAGEKFVVHRE